MTLFDTVCKSIKTSSIQNCHFDKMSHELLRNACKNYHNGGSIDELRRLLASKVDVNSSTSESALFFCIDTSEHKLVRELVDANADVNMTHDRNWAPLIVSTCYGNTKIMKILLEAKADTEAVNSSGETALMSVIQRSRDWEPIELLIESKANVNTKEHAWGRTPAHIACKRGDLYLLKKLVEYKADVSDKSRSGPLSVALCEGKHDCSRFIMDVWDNIERLKFVRLSFLIHCGRETNGYKKNNSFAHIVSESLRGFRNIRKLVSDYIYTN